MSKDTSASQYSEPPWSRNVPGTNLPWYVPNIDKYLTPTVTDMLENYSKVPHDKLSTHLHGMRDKTYAIAPYPTIGVGVFITPYIPLSPGYPVILKTLKNKPNATFLDIGSMLGIDMRKLTIDGVPSSIMTGVDIRPEFWDLGFEFYRDRETFQARGVEGDVLALSHNPDLQGLRERKVDVISISAVLHQFDWNSQLAALKELIAYSKPGTIVAGHQIGNKKGGPDTFGPVNTPVFKHDDVTFKKLWMEAGLETGTQWDVEAWVRGWGDFGWDANDMKFMKEGDGPLEFFARRRE